MSKIELLAKHMRELALKSDKEIKLLEEPVEISKIDLSEPLKRIYFHAGRWSAGSKDFTARKAYEIYSKREGLL